MLSLSQSICGSVSFTAKRALACETRVGPYITIVWFLRSEISFEMKDRFLPSMCVLSHNLFIRELQMKAFDKFFQIFITILKSFSSFISCLKEEYKQKV